MRYKREHFTRVAFLILGVVLATANKERALLLGVILSGVICNVLAVRMNGGFMPVRDFGAWSRQELLGSSTHRLEDPKTRLRPLCDIIPIKGGGMVMSVGDLLIAIPLVLFSWDLAHDSFPVTRWIGYVGLFVSTELAAQAILNRRLEYWFARRRRVQRLRQYAAANPPGGRPWTPPRFPTQTP